MNTPFSNTSFSFKNTRRSPFNLLFLIDPYLGIHPDELTEPNHDGKRDMDINPLAEVEKLKTKENSKFYSETSSLPLLPPPSLSAFLTHQNLTSNSQFIPLFRQFLEHFLTYVHSHYRHLVQCAFHLISAPTVKPPFLSSFSSTFIQSCCHIVGKALRSAKSFHATELAECLFWLSTTVLNPAVTLSQSTLVSPARPIQEKLQSSILVRHSIFIVSSHLPTLDFLNEMKHQYQLNAPLLASNIVLHWIHLPLCGQLTSIQEIQYMNAFGGICVSLPLDYRLPFSLIFGPFLQRQISSPQVMECLNQLPSIPSLLYPTYENDIFLELDGVQFLGVPTTPFSFSKGPWLACSEAHLDSSLVLLLPSYEVQHSVLLDDPKKAIFSCFPSTGKFSVNVKWYQNVATHQQAFCFPICDSRVFFHILTYPLSSLNFPPTLSSPVPSSLFHSHVSERTFPSLPTVHAMEPFFSPTFNESLPSSLNPFSSPIELQLEFLNPSMPTTPCLPSTPFSTSPFVNLIDLVLELTYTTTPPFPNFYRRLPELRPQFFSCLSSLISTNAQLSEKFKIQLPLFFKNTTSMNWSSQEHSYLESHVCDSSEQQHQWMIQSWIRACCLQCVFYFEDLLIQPDQVEHHTTQLQFLLSRLELLCSQHHQRLMLDHHWQVDVKSWFEQVMVYHYYSSFPTLIHDLYVQLGGEIESYKAHTVHPFSPLPTRKKSAKLPTTPSFHRSFPVKTHPTQKGSSSGPGSTRKSRLMQRLRGAREIVIKDQGSNKRELKEEEEEDEEDDDDDEGEEEDNEEKDQRKEREKRNFSDMHFNFEKNKRKKEKLQMVPNVSIRRRKNDFLGIDEAEEKVKVKVKDKDQEEEEEEEESFWAAESPTKRISKKKEIKKALFGALVFGARLRGQPELTLSKEIELDVSEERPEPWVVKSSGSSFQDRFQSFVAKYSLGLSSSSQES